MSLNLRGARPNDSPDRGSSRRPNTDRTTSSDACAPASIPLPVPNIPASPRPPQRPAGSPCSTADPKYRAARTPAHVRAPARARRSCSGAQVGRVLVPGAATTPDEVVDGARDTAMTRSMIDSLSRSSAGVDQDH